MARLRIVFMGTGDIALPSFRSLAGGGGGELVALVTQPDKPVGRHQVITSSRIKNLAEGYGIPVMQPEKARHEGFLADLKEFKPDIIVVMAYGQILVQKLLDIPRVATINLHASLLPKYRGAACIQAAIESGDDETGITVMHVAKALDAGDIILSKSTLIGKRETGGELHDRLADMAPEAMLEALDQLEKGTAARTPQDEAEVSYIPRLMRDDGEIDWSQEADVIERRIRAYDPWPGTSTFYSESKGRHQGRKRRLKIFPQVAVTDGVGRAGEILSCDDGMVVACGERALRITNLQPDGSRRMTAAEFMLGGRLAVGGVLGGKA